VISGACQTVSDDAAPTVRLSRRGAAPKPGKSAPEDAIESTKKRSPSALWELDGTDHERAAREAKPSQSIRTD
jgi:hypothetical protein